MINISYVHGCDHLNDHELEAKSDAAYISSKLSDILYYESKISDLDFFGESESDEMKLMTEGVLDGLQAIGKKIIEIVSRIKKFFTDAISNLKEKVWGKDDTIKKIKAEINKDPKKASLQIRNLVDSGKMSIDDFRGLSGYYKEIDNVLDQLEKDNCNPESLKAKLYKAEDKVKKGAAVIVSVGAVATAMVSINKFLQQYKKEDPLKDKGLQDIQKQTDIRLMKVQRLAQAISNPNTSNPDEMKKCRTRASVLAQAAVSLERTTEGYVSRRTKRTANLFKMADKALSVCHAGKKDAYETTKKEYQDRAHALKKQNKDILNRMRETEKRKTPDDSKKRR